MVTSPAGTCFWYCQADGRIFGQVNWKTWKTKRKRRKETRKRKEKSWKSRKSKFNSSRAYHGKGCSPFRLRNSLEILKGDKNEEPWHQNPASGEKWITTPCEKPANSGVLMSGVFEGLPLYIGIMGFFWHYWTHFLIRVFYIDHLKWM